MIFKRYLANYAKFLVSTKSPKPAEVLVSTTVIVVIAICLAEAYARLGAVFGEAWIGAASLHTIISSLVVIAIFVRRNGVEVFSFCTVKEGAPALLRKRAWCMYVPALIVILSAFLAILVSRQFAEGNPQQAVILPQVAWVIWIPIVEEIVFRLGFGQRLRFRLGNLWGSWLSATLFALVHASPTIINLSEGKFGLPLGPFLLGLCCELLFIVTGRLMAVVALHAACNGTAMIFALCDDRWLNWLDFLYG